MEVGACGDAASDGQASSSTTANTGGNSADGSGGQGASGNYIGGASINYARYLGEFFSQNNARVNRNLPPNVDGLTLAANGDAIQISGQAADEDGTVTAITIVIEGLAGGGDTLTTTVAGGGAFQATSGGLADDLYTVAVTAEDNDGGESDPAIATLDALPGVSKVAALTGMAGFEAS